MSHDEIGAFVRSVPVPRQTNDPDITVVSLDLHENGFVVRCDVGGRRGLLPDGIVATDLRDSLSTQYERAGHGEDFIAYTPPHSCGGGMVEGVHEPRDSHQPREVELAPAGRVSVVRGEASLPEACTRRVPAESLT